MGVSGLDDVYAPDGSVAACSPLAPSEIPFEQLLHAADGARDARRYSEAADLYRTYLWQQPDRAAIWVQFGHMLKESGNTDDAGLAYEQALKIEPFDADTHLQYGHLLKITGNTTVALQMYSRALELDPQSRDAARELTMLRNEVGVERKEGASTPQLFCHWLWHGATVLCDGTVTCGLDDPFKQRSYGNLKSETMHDVLRKPAIAKRREDLLAGKACEGCSMYTTAARMNDVQLRPSSPFPHRLIIEPSIRCNIRCRNSTCDIANDASFHLRREDFMSWPLFTKLMDEVGPYIKELYFYNYGEPFVHPKALDMLAYAKAKNPDLNITTSTNGILLARAGMAERIVGEGLLDYVCFTAGGVDQETYVRYHKSGSFEKVLHAMRRMMEERRRTGKTKPFVHWRYLLFRWNDSDEHIAEALRLRDELGVDELKFMLSWTPMDGRSLRRAPGTAGFAAIKEHAAYQDGYCPEPYGEAGLWQPEDSPELGRLCWTGRHVRIQTTPAGDNFTLRFSRPEMLDVPKSKVKIRLPWREAEGEVAARGWAENRFDIPVEYVGRTIPIDLEIDPIFSPLRHIDSADSRDLGIMLSMEGISVQPNPYRLGAVSLEPAADQTRGEVAWKKELQLT